MAKSSDKDRIFKAARENSYIQEKSHKAIGIFFIRNFAGQERVAASIQSAEREKKKKKLQSKIFYPERISFIIEK